MTAIMSRIETYVKYINANILLDTASLFPLHSESIRSVRTPPGDAGWRERKAALGRRRSTAAAENRDGGGAPGGAARPKQAVRASGSSVARATPEAWAGGNIRPRGVAHDPGASRRSTEERAWLFVRMAFGEFGFGKTRTQTNAPRERRRSSLCLSVDFTRLHRSRRRMSILLLSRGIPIPADQNG